VETLLIAAVRRLGGCLPYLPRDVRRVLELRAGINAVAPLTPGAVAERLHLKLSRVYRLERVGLGRLVRTARVHACAAVAEPPPEAPTMSLFGALLAEEPPAGGVKGARYSQAPQEEPAAPGTNRPSTSGIVSPQAATGLALLLLLAGVGAVLLVGLLFADGAAPWPPSGERRSRWIHHHPWNWRK
jgi:hypothetical protein